MNLKGGMKLKYRENKISCKKSLFLAKKKKKSKAVNE